MPALSTPITIAAESAPPPAALAEGLLVWVVALAGLALLPFVLTMVTSFAKLVIVGGIIRQALGTQQVPPNTVITGLALILSIHVMWPVGERIYAAIPTESRARLLGASGGPTPAAESSGKRADRRLSDVTDALSAARAPVRDFLEKNSDPANIRLFRRLAQVTAQRGNPQIAAATAATDGPSVPSQTPPQAPAWIDELVILTPAFVLTELTEAFKIGFLIFVPFLVLDLVVSNILLALGMQMLAPQTVSLPLKLMLFVLVDGWTVIVKGLVLSYH